MSDMKPNTQPRLFDSQDAAISWLREHGHPEATPTAMTKIGSGMVYVCRWRDGGSSDPIVVLTGGQYKHAVLRFLDGRLDRRFDSLSEAARDLVEHGHPKAAASSIQAVIRLPRRRAYGYQWRYEDEWDGNDLEVPAPRKRAPRHRPEYPRKAVDTRKKSVIGTDPDGNDIRFESISAAGRYCRAHGWPKATAHLIGDAAQGYTLTAYGYQWRYADDQEREKGPHLP